MIWYHSGFDVRWGCGNLPSRPSRSRTTSLRCALRYPASARPDTAVAAHRHVAAAARAPHSTSHCGRTGLGSGRPQQNRQDMAESNPMRGFPRLRRAAVRGGVGGGEDTAAEETGIQEMRRNGDAKYTSEAEPIPMKVQL